MLASLIVDDEAARGVGIGLLGAGAWGAKHLAHLHRSGQLRAVYDPEWRAISARAPDSGIPWAESLEQVIDHCDVVGVIVAAPVSEHHRLAMLCLERGRSVLVEKPITPDAQSAQRLVDYASSKGLVALPGHLLRLHPGIQRLKSLAVAESFGSVRGISACRHNFGVVRSWEDVLLSLGTHDIDLLSFVTGLLPVSVSCATSSPLGAVRADSAEMTLAYAGGLTASVSLSWISPLPRREIVMLGDGQALVLDDTEPWSSKLRHLSYSLGASGRPADVRTESISLNEVDLLQAEQRLFTEAIVGEVVSAEHAAAAGKSAIDGLRVLEAAALSAGQGGCPVSVSRDGRPSGTE